MERIEIRIVKILDIFANSQILLHFASRGLSDYWVISVYAPDIALARTAVLLPATRPNTAQFARELPLPK